MVINIPIPFTRGKGVTDKTPLYFVLFFDFYVERSGKKHIHGILNCTLRVGVLPYKHNNYLDEF